MYSNDPGKRGLVRAPSPIALRGFVTDKTTVEVLLDIDLCPFVVAQSFFVLIANVGRQSVLAIVLL